MRMSDQAAVAALVNDLPRPGAHRVGVRRAARRLKAHRPDGTVASVAEVDGGALAVAGSVALYLAYLARQK